MVRRDLDSDSDLTHALPRAVRRPAAGPARRLRDRLARFRDALPHGNMLRPETWAHRHLLITRFALAQAVALGGFALLMGRGIVEAVVSMLLVAAPAVLGMVPSAPRMLRMLSAVVSLMSASAVLVDLTHGLTEAHFHFFVMLGVVSLYQDWAAFGMCVLVTVLHHAVMGLTTPSAVFGATEQREHPVRWAVLHGAFILAASITHIVAWKLNEQQELRDPLTQLPNRTAFVDRLQTVLRTTADPVTVLFLDIDNFKTINDSGGHHVGDAALFHAAQTMAHSLTGDDLVARLGGDEFALLIAGDATTGTAAADRIRSSLQSPTVVDGREVFVTASIGVADTELAGSREVEDLLRDADLAMYVAKSSGKNRVVTYTTGVDSTVRERALLSRDLHHALELGQFDVHYQPVVNAQDRRMCGVEALVRWQHPDLGLLSPGVFIPLAEENGDITGIGAWVLATAAAQVAAWQRDVPGCEDLDLAVNLAPAQLRDPQLLVYLGEALRTSGLAPSRLTLEVTESTLLLDLDLARRQLDAVRALGVQVAIDDFGTGYSSLSYLARLPADQVKIDRSFIAELEPGSTSMTLVRSILDMARALSLDVQAEGVEEELQQEILDELGCPRSQGYLYSYPLTSTDFVSFVHAGGSLIPPHGPLVVQDVPA